MVDHRDVRPEGFTATPADGGKHVHVKTLQGSREADMAVEVFTGTNADSPFGSDKPVTPGATYWVRVSWSSHRSFDEHNGYDISITLD